MRLCASSVGFRYSVSSLTYRSNASKSSSKHRPIVAALQHEDIETILFSEDDIRNKVLQMGR